MTDTADILRAMAGRGPLTASRLVNEAEASDHPLHDRFQWDDSAAAHEYRLIQARQIIVSVVERPEGASRSIPVFVHVPNDAGEGEYVLTSFAVRQPERWQLAQSQALNYLRGAEDKIAAMAEAMRLATGRKTTPRRIQKAATLVREAGETLGAVG